MKFKLIFFSLLLTVSLSARKVDGGEAFFNNKQYAKARAVYEQLLKQKPNDALYNFRYALCCYELKDVESAIIHFEMCGNRFPMRDLYLGELYFNTYRFDQSIMAYQTYMSTLKPSDSKLPDYQQKVKLAEAGVRMLAKVDDIALIDSFVVNKSEFLKAYKCSRELGTLKQEPIKISSRRTVDKITYTTQRNDRVYFSDTIKGRIDLFTSYKLLDSWSEPTAISPVVNTSANENYPFLLLDGVTVYFASDGENSMGGYDIFVTRFSPSTNTYLAPENIGFPFNSPANDYMMVIDEQHKIGWFASDRNQPAGKVVIYSFVPSEAKTIIRSDDKEYVRRTAQLKQFRKAVLIDSANVVATQNNAVATEKQIEFIVNDSVVYTRIDQFKSEGGGKLWSEIHTLSGAIEKLKLELVVQRTMYANSANDADKNKISETILDLERRNVIMEKLLATKTAQLRNDENKFISTAK